MSAAPEFSQPGGPLRQSLLRSAEQCMLATKWKAQSSYSSPAAALGTVLHAIYAEALRTMKRTGNNQIPTEEMAVISREVYAGLPILLPAAQRRDMRWLLWKFCEMRWTSSRILYVEERFTVDVPCPDGVVRQFTGQPDVIIADPPRTAIIVDHKTGWARPPRVQEGESPGATADHGRRYLSATGTYQLDAYGLLVFLAMPRVERVILREHHWRWAETREAFMDRTELEHVLPELGAHLMKLATALEEGDDSPLWQPRPGSWCHYCPRPLDCPIPQQARVGGAIVDADDVASWSDLWVTTKDLHARVDRELKSAHAEGLAPALVGDRTLGWDREGPGRRFQLHERVDSPERQHEQAMADEAFKAAV